MFDYVVLVLELLGYFVVLLLSSVLRIEEFIFVLAGLVCAYELSRGECTCLHTGFVGDDSGDDEAAVDARLEVDVPGDHVVGHVLVGILVLPVDEFQGLVEVLAALD